MNNNNESPLPISLLDLAESFSSDSERAAYLQGFTSALLSAAACISSHAAAIVSDANETGKIPHPIVIMNLLQQHIAKMFNDGQAVEQALTTTGTAGVRSMIKLLTTPEQRGSDGKKIIQ